MSVESLAYPPNSAHVDPTVFARLNTSNLLALIVTRTGTGEVVVGGQRVGRRHQLETKRLPRYLERLLNT